MTTQEMIAENSRLRKKIAEMQAESKAYKDKIKMLESRENDLEGELKRIREENSELNSGVTILELEVEELELELSTKESLLEIVSANHESGLPREPISVAEMLINAEMESDIRHFMACSGESVFRERQKTYGVSELRQIAEHLLVYCKANEENSEVEEPKEEQQKPKTKIKKSDYMFFDGRNLEGVKEFIGKDGYINIENLFAVSKNGFTTMGSISVECYVEPFMTKTTIVPVRNYIVKIDGEYFSATPDEFERCIEVEDDEQ